VEMHGGTVNARSNGDGAGSEFVVRLPLTTMRPAAAVVDAVAVFPSTGLTVVVAEDNADTREMLCAILSQAGLSCHGAADGPEALRLIDQVSPAVVILDVGLPHMDGLEVARRIRASRRHRNVQLIALTGYGQASDRQATRQAGFDHHLVKPVHPADLLALLARLQGPLSIRPASTDAPPQFNA
jgi:two-component system, chemotaxis family, CheB/CheR fusion protein